MHPEPFKSPRPPNSEIEALQLPSVATRLAVDFISIFLGVTVTLVRFMEPAEWLLSGIPIAAGVAFAVFVQKRGLGRAWQSIGFGGIGTLVGFSLPPPTPPKESLELYIASLIWACSILAVTPVLAALCWKILDQRNNLDPERCDSYQAFRRAVGFHLYLVLIVLALLLWTDGYGVPLISAVIVSLLLWRLMRVTVPRNMATPGAVYTYLWTPMLPLLTILTINNATMGRASLWVAIAILLSTTIALTIFAPRWQGEQPSPSWLKELG